MRTHLATLGCLLALAACSDNPQSTLENDATTAESDSNVSPIPSCSQMIAQPLDSDWTIVSGGIERTLHVHVPAQYNPAVPTPLVFNFHGFTSNGAQQRLLSGMDGKADQEGFISVHANGTGVPASWNAGACCGYAQENQIDDVQFVRDMLTELENRLCVDATRIYATGMSNGGFLSHRLACDLSDRIAAIAPVAGPSVLATCQPSRPVPVLHFHGGQDLVVPYLGSTSLGFPPVEANIAAWAQRNGCSEDIEEVLVQGDASCIAYSECPAGGEVVLCTIDGGGHTWPGGLPVPALGKTSTDISATDFMWDFLKEHQLPPQP